MRDTCTNAKPDLFDAFFEDRFSSASTEKLTESQNTPSSVNDMLSQALDSALSLQRDTDHRSDPNSAASLAEIASPGTLQPRGGNKTSPPGRFVAAAASLLGGTRVEASGEQPSAGAGRGEGESAPIGGARGGKPALVRRKSASQIRTSASSRRAITNAMSWGVSSELVNFSELLGIENEDPAAKSAENTSKKGTMLHGGRQAKKKRASSQPTAFHGAVPQGAAAQAAGAQVAAPYISAPHTFPRGSGNPFDVHMSAATRTLQMPHSFGAQVAAPQIAAPHTFPRGSGNLFDVHMGGANPPLQMPHSLGAQVAAPQIFAPHTLPKRSGNPFDVLTGSANPTRQMPHSLGAQTPISMHMQARHPCFQYPRQHLHRQFQCHSLPSQARSAQPAKALYGSSLEMQGGTANLYGIGM